MINLDTKGKRCVNLRRFDVETVEKLTKIRLAVRIVVIDLVVTLGAALLVVENQRRWPILLVVGPLLFFINFTGIQRLKQKTEGRRSTSLPVIYGFGTLLGLCWVIKDFEWWKCISLAIVLLLLGATLLAQRNGLNNKG